MCLYSECHLFGIISMKIVKRLELFKIRRYIKCPILLLCVEQTIRETKTEKHNTYIIVNSKINVLIY